MYMTITAEHHATRLTPGQLNKIRAKLAKDREQTHDFMAQLLVELESMRSSRQDVPTDDEHDPEGPTLAFERSQALAVFNNTKAHFDGIEAALARVDGERFGLCAGCGERIPYARLEVRPYTEHCVECADRAGR